MLSVSVRVGPWCSVIVFLLLRRRGEPVTTRTGILRIGERDASGPPVQDVESRRPRSSFGGQHGHREVGMEAPKRIRPKGLADYLEVMTKAAFQSGISWRVIEAKWTGSARRSSASTRSAS